MERLVGVFFVGSWNSGFTQYCQLCFFFNYNSLPPEAKRCDGETRTKRSSWLRAFGCMSMSIPTHEKLASNHEPIRQRPSEPAAPAPNKNNLQTTVSGIGNGTIHTQQQSFSYPQFCSALSTTMFSYTRDSCSGALAQTSAYVDETILRHRRSDSWRAETISRCVTGVLLKTETVAVRLFQLQWPNNATTICESCYPKSKVSVSCSIAKGCHHHSCLVLVLLWYLIP